MVGEQFIFPEMPLTPGATCHTPTRSWACGKGSGLISTLFTTLKMAVVAPMPSASVTSAVAVNPGAWARRRSTCFSGPMVGITERGASGFAKFRIVDEKHVPLDKLKHVALARPLSLDNPDSYDASGKSARMI